MYKTINLGITLFRDQFLKCTRMDDLASQLKLLILKLRAFLRELRAFNTTYWWIEEATSTSASGRFIRHIQVQSLVFKNESGLASLSRHVWSDSSWILLDSDAQPMALKTLIDTALLTIPQYKDFMHYSSSLCKPLIHSLFCETVNIH